jgi:hypothetical protein
MADIFLRILVSQLGAASVRLRLIVAITMSPVLILRV